MSLPIRPNVLRMAPYSPGKPIEDVQRELGLEQVVKLASNENPFGPSPRAIEAMQKAAATSHLYPDAAATDLVERLAELHDVPKNQIALGNGSDNLIQVIGHVMLGSATDCVVVGSPSFVRYGSIAQLAGCRLTEVPATSEWALDAQAMAAAANSETRLAFLANPNNPTGSYTSATNASLLVEAVRDSGLAVFDEAYYEFACDQPDYPPSIEWVRQGRPVAVLRTFSKAYGLAGVRLGYLVGPAELVDAVNRAREPFNVNRIAQAAALAALDDPGHVARTVEGTQRSLATIVDACRTMRVPCLPTWANFVCIEVGGDDVRVAQDLQARGVIVRPGSVLGMPGFLRVSAGTPEETSAFLEALAPVLAERMEPSR
ncbi:MAG: histidinol-phosphate transaminase [Fimbriimonadaceae bacterium]